MPVISPRRSTSTTSGSLYIPQTTSGTYSSSLANKSTGSNTLSSSSTSGYSSNYRSNGFTKTPSASTYSSYYTGSYLPRTSAYSSVGRSTYSSTSSSALSGGSSALSSYRPGSYLSGGNNDTTASSSRFGVSRFYTSNLGSRDTTPSTTTTTTNNLTNRRRSSLLLSNRLLGFCNLSSAAAANAIPIKFQSPTKTTTKTTPTPKCNACFPTLHNGVKSSCRQFEDSHDSDPTSNSKPFCYSTSAYKILKSLSFDHDANPTSNSDHSTNFYLKTNNNENLSKSTLNSPSSATTTKSIQNENENEYINNNNNNTSSSLSSSSITIIDDQSLRHANINKNRNILELAPKRDLDLRTGGKDNTDCNINHNHNSNTISPRSSSTCRNSRISSSYSSSSLARLVATSALDIYEKYSPAHYIPKCELSRSSSLSEAGASAATATENAAKSSKINDINNAKNSISKNNTSNNNYSRRYSRQTNGTINENCELSTPISSTSASFTDNYLSVPHSSSSKGGNANKLLLHVSYDLQDDSNSLRDLKISCISPTTTTTTSMSSTAATSCSPSYQDTKDTDAQLATKQKRSVEAATTTTTTAAVYTTIPKTRNTITTISTTPNPTLSATTLSAKAGNQQFFLISAFKDQNFLKNECDLARSQVYRSRQKFENNNVNDDSFNNNNSNNDTSNSNNNGGNNIANNNENGSPLAGSNSSIVNTINDNRKLQGINNKQQPSIKPLIHRTPNNKFLNKIPAKNDNNMHCLYSSSELLDDIKYIDSDDTERQQQQYQQRQHNKPKLRPKSSIISTSNQSLFEKVNQYKYQNGSTLSSSPPVSSSAPTSTTSTATSSPSTLPLMGGRRRDVIHDTFSIKASIEKFNTLSEAKRLPTRNSTTNLQLASDSERRLPLRERSASPATSSNATTRGSSIISSNLAASNSSSSGSIANNNLFLRNRSTESSPSHSPKNLRKTSVTSASPLLNGSTSNLSTKSGATFDKVTLTTVSMLSCPTPTLSTVTSKTISNDKKLPPPVSTSSKLTDNDGSVRNSSSLRNALPPISPTPARHWERDSSRSSLLSGRNLSDDYSSSSTKFSSSNSDDKQEQEGLCGLRNIGNTCFMNSVIQCLSHTSELTKFLKTQNGVRCSSSKDQQILCEFAKLIREMWTSNVNSVTPSELKRAFSSKHRMYSDYNQQDAQEFLRFFLDSLHSALNSGVKGDHLKIDESLSDNRKADITWDWYTKSENSVIRDLFVGQLKSTLRCTVCGNASVTFDPFWDLSVPLPSSSRCKLEACLDLFIREEVLDGDEMPTCSKCQTRRKSTKSFTIQRFPKYLVIHLKRFSETRWSKMSNIVEFPTGERELNMGPYASNSSTNAYYTLYAISNHMGSTAGGHYVALCKHPVTKKWHEFNDNIVSGDLSESHLVSSSAYILFYERAHRRRIEHDQAINFLSRRAMPTAKRKYRLGYMIPSHETNSFPFEESRIYQSTHVNPNNMNNYRESTLLNTFLGMLFYVIFFTSCYYLFFNAKENKTELN